MKTGRIALSEVRKKCAYSILVRRTQPVRDKKHRSDELWGRLFSSTSVPSLAPFSQILAFCLAAFVSVAPASPVYDLSLLRACPLPLRSSFAPIRFSLSSVINSSRPAINSGPSSLGFLALCAEPRCAASSSGTSRSGSLDRRFPRAAHDGSICQCRRGTAP